MIRISKCLVAAGCFIGAAHAVEAADLSAPQPYVPYSSPVVEPAATGWYLRGDVGVGITKIGSWHDDNVDYPASGIDAQYLGSSIGDTTNIDVGIGYQMSESFRGDVTLQYRTATGFHGADILTDTTTNPYAYVENSINGNISSTVLMANGYWDIAHYNGLTPYIGAGIGAAYNHTSGTHDMTAGTYPVQYGTYSDQGVWSLAYALHAGLSYDINSRLKLEAGYSFLSLGDAKTTLTSCSGDYGTTTCSDRLRIKNLTANDFHIGMRWMLEPAGETPVGYHPVIAKY